jgi:hypothetical protein
MKPDFIQWSVGIGACLFKRMTMLRELGVERKLFGHEGERK